MVLTIRMAGHEMAFILEGEAEEARSICEYVFEGFIQPNSSPRAELRITVLTQQGTNPAFFSRYAKMRQETRMAISEVMAGLNEMGVCRKDIPQHDHVLALFYINALLLFDGKTSGGRIYLLGPVAANIGPLYRLFWIYCANVLGLEGACFLHAAALTKDEKGYLFLGDSGAGKSTVIQLTSGFQVYSDDAPILQRSGADYRIYPSPFHQLRPDRDLDPIVIQQSAELAFLYFLKKDTSIFLEDVPPATAVSAILNRFVHYFLYLSAEARTKIFNLVFDLCHSLPPYEFHFERKKMIPKKLLG